MRFRLDRSTAAVEADLLNKVVTQVRFRLDRSTAAVEADLLNTEFTGGYRLMLVAPQRMASSASCFWRLITRRNTTIQEGE